ncbi:reverse transcriptase domain-containing protein, partial [Tanacetum coccineum]
MRTRSSSNLVGESSPNPTTSNPKRRNRRRSKQPFSLEESPVDTMADQRTMAELLRAPTEGYAEAIVVPPILAEHFELKHSLINMMTSDQFFGLEKDNPHDHIRWFNKITSTIKYKDVPNSAIKLMLFPFSLAGAARRWLEKEPPRSILTWEDLVSKFINEFFPPSRTTNLRNEISNFQQRFEESFHEAWDRYKDLLRACPHHGFTELHQLDTFYNALNPADQDSLNSAAGGNLLERLNQQTSAVATAMTAILKQFQATPPPASVKAVEKICVTCGGTHPYYQCLTADGNNFWDNIQGYVSAAAINYNQGNSGYRPLSVANQIPPPGFAQPNVKNNQNRFSQPQGYNRGNNFKQDTSYQAPIQQNQVVPLSELEKIKKINEVNIKSMQAQINNVKNELRNEMQTSIQASMSNQTIELKNMMASFFQMNTASTSGSGSLPSNTIANPIGELKSITTRSGLVLNGPSVPMPPLFINPEEDERAEETLQTRNSLSIPLRSELKCKALADLGASVNLMPLFVWKKLGLPELISTRMTLELANRAICTSDRIARDVFVPIGKFRFPADFVIVDYERDPRVPLILGRPFLRTAHALIDVHEEEMILHDGDDILILNMRHDTSSYSNKPKKESINMIDIYNVSHEAYLEELFANEKATNHQSGNPTFSSHIDLTSPEVINPLSGNPTPILEPVTKSSSSPTLTSLDESNLIWEEFKAYLASDSFPAGSDDTNFDPEGDLCLTEELLKNDPSSLLILSNNPLSGSTTSSSPNHLLEEFTDELALITFPPGNDDLPFDIESDLREIEYLLNNDPTKEMDSILEDLVDEDNLADPNNDFVDTIPEMFTDEHTLDYSSPPLYDDLVELEFDNDDVYDDPFDSKEDKIKESKLLIDELNPPRSSDFLSSPNCDSVLYEDFFEVDALPSTKDEDK